MSYLDGAICALIGASMAGAGYFISIAVARKRLGDIFHSAAAQALAELEEEKEETHGE